MSLAKNLSKNGKINNDINLAVFASQDRFIKGTKSSARFASGSSFNIDLPKEEEIYYSAGLGYNYLNKENNTSLMANIFLIKNDEDDMNSNIFSFTFRKLFGEFKKGRIPPVIVKKIDKQKDNTQNNTKEDQTLEELEENIKIVLKKEVRIRRHFGVPFDQKMNLKCDCVPVTIVNGFGLILEIIFMPF